LKFWQAIQGCNGLEPLAIVHRRIAGIHGAGHRWVCRFSR
jgi:hypothetical protein